MQICTIHNLIRYHKTKAADSAAFQKGEDKQFFARSVGDVWRGKDLCLVCCQKHDLTETVISMTTCPENIQMLLKKYFRFDIL